MREVLSIMSDRRNIRFHHFLWKKLNDDQLSVCSFVRLSKYRAAYIVCNYVLTGISVPFQLSTELSGDDPWVLDRSEIWWQRLKEKINQNTSINKARLKYYTYLV